MVFDDGLILIHPYRKEIGGLATTPIGINYIALYKRSEEDENNSYNLLAVLKEIESEDVFNPKFVFCPIEDIDLQLLGEYLNVIAELSRNYDHDLPYEDTTPIELLYLIGKVHKPEGEIRLKPENIITVKDLPLDVPKSIKARNF